MEIMGEKCTVLVEKPEGNSSFRRPRYEWESIKRIFKETKAQLWT
jgi:hypothetical protein